MKRQLKEWENICNHVCGKVIMSRIYRKTQFNNEEFNLKIDKGFEQTFFQIIHTNGQYVHGQILNIVSHQTTTRSTRSYHFTLSRLVIMTRRGNESLRGYRETGIRVHC